MEPVSVNDLGKILELMVWPFLSHSFLSTYYVPGSVLSSLEQDLSLLFSQNSGRK